MLKYTVMRLGLFAVCFGIVWAVWLIFMRLSNQMDGGKTKWPGALNATRAIGRLTRRVGSAWR